jgi:hypothetical protein
MIWGASGSRTKDSCMVSMYLSISNKPRSHRGILSSTSENFSNDGTKCCACMPRTPTTQIILLQRTFAKIEPSQHPSETPSHTAENASLSITCCETWNKQALGLCLERSRCGWIYNLVFLVISERFCLEFVFVWLRKSV